MNSNVKGGEKLELKAPRLAKEAGLFLLGQLSLPP